MDLSKSRYKRNVKARRDIKRRRKRKNDNIKLSLSQKKISFGFFNHDIKNADASYTNIMNGTKHPDSILWYNRCELLWNKFKPYADKGFLTGAQKDFNARFWEMDLCIGLMQCGYKVASEDCGPDILIDTGKDRINIEAVCPEEGTGKDKVPGFMDCVDIHSTIEKQILRLTSAFNDKHDIYKNYIESNVIAKSDINIIAISGSRLPNRSYETSPSIIVKAMFPLGEETLAIDKISGKGVSKDYSFKPDITKGETKTKIDLTGFCSGKYKTISAVIYSPSDVTRNSEVLDTCITVINPYAVNKLDVDKINFGRIYYPVEKGDGFIVMKMIDRNENL